MARIGLTGASGIMGQTLRKNFPSVEWLPFEAEILNSADIKKWIKDSGSFDAVIHLAAIVPTHLVDADPARALKVNVEGTVNLLECLREAYSSNYPWIFLASTGHVYASSDRPLTEVAPLAPISLYGLTKLQAEEWAGEYQRRFKQLICVGRIFSSSSPLHPETYFIPAMIRKISQAGRGAVLEVHGLKGTRDFQTADQVSQAIHFLFEKKATGIFNIASGASIRLVDLVARIQKRLGREDVKVVALDRDTSHLNADVEKMKKLGFAPCADLDALLDQVMGNTYPS